MDPGIFAATIAAAFVIGALIGSVGVGGLLMAPWFVLVARTGVREAIVLSTAAFIATGLMAVWLFWRGEAAVGPRWPAIAATVPGALLGAIALAAIPATLAGTVLALFLVVTGLRMLIARHPMQEAKPGPRRLADGVTGFFTGFFSALTGTGGPMVMVPILLWRGTPLLAAIALGQVVQLPIASVATATNLMAGWVNLTPAALVAVPMVAGVACGRIGVRHLPLGVLSKAMAFLLIATGLWFAVKQW